MITLFRVPRIEIRRVFLTDGTGYIGAPLAAALTRRDHEVSGPAHAGTPLAGFDTVVHLAERPALMPGEAKRLRGIHLDSTRGAVDAAKAARVAHFVYASNHAETSPEAETLVRQSGLNVTILRPWYVLGPGHRWPMLLTPLIRLAGLLPATAEAAQRLVPVTLEQMVRALVKAIEIPARGERIVEAADIRAGLVLRAEPDARPDPVQAAAPLALLRTSGGQLP